jgi:hypothetical protein
MQEDVCVSFAGGACCGPVGGTYGAAVGADSAAQGAAGHRGQLVDAGRCMRHSVLVGLAVSLWAAHMVL